MLSDDLNMPAVISGRERFLSEYDTLITPAGMRRTSVIGANHSPESTIEAVDDGRIPIALGERSIASPTAGGGAEEPKVVSMIHSRLTGIPASRSAFRAPKRRPVAVEVKGGPDSTAMSACPRSSGGRRLLCE